MSGEMMKIINHNCWSIFDQLTERFCSFAPEFVVVNAPTKSFMCLGSIAHQAHVNKELLGPARELMGKLSHVYCEGFCPLINVSDFVGSGLGSFLGFDHGTFKC